MCFSSLSIISNISLFVKIHSAVFTLFLCMKLILVFNRYIWCFIVYTSYGCFCDVHLRIEVKCQAKGQGERNYVPHVGKGLAKIQVLGH